MIRIHQLPIMNLDDNETGCCPRFKPDAWDEKTFKFEDLIFAKATSKSFFYMPTNLGKVMTEAQARIDRADAADKDRYLILTQDVSKWKADHYFKVDKKVPDMPMVTLSGTFMTKVFDVDYKEMTKVLKEFQRYIEANGKTLKEQFIFYTTCPKCAKHYGHNYMVMFARI